MSDSSDIRCERVDDVQTLLTGGGYIADRSLATALFLALRLERPLLLEGEAGVGKTELARVLAERMGRRLIRLQCYEGLDIAGAVYEWNYPRQMIAIRLAEIEPDPRGRMLETDIYDADYLIRRPLLQALTPHPEGPPVLLIDELDRTDEPFEAYLLELLADWQISIPELGPIRAEHPPITILTSNRTREIHDALKRRCLYHWVDYPDFERELEILQGHVPEAADALHRRVVAFAQRLRKIDLFKPPGVAETVDWCRALVQLDAVTLTPELIADTLGALLKYQDDILRLRDGEAARLLEECTGS